jgi:hypothetical protein
MIATVREYVPCRLELVHPKYGVEQREKHAVHTYVLHSEETRVEFEVQRREYAYRRTYVRTPTCCCADPTPPGFICWLQPRAHESDREKKKRSETWRARAAAGR